MSAKKKWPFPSAYLRTYGVSWGHKGVQPELRWEGTNVALVRFPGHGESKMFGTYYKTRWEVLGRLDSNPDRSFGASSGVKFWESKEDERLTPSVMVEKAQDVDANYASLVARRKAEQHLRDEAARVRREKENARVDAEDRLRNAAPEMLKVLEALAEANDFANKSQTVSPICQPALWRAVNLVIAKVKGDSRG